MPRSSAPHSPDYQSLTLENCHVLYNVPVSHFIVTTAHTPDCGLPKPWVSSITIKRYGGWRKPFLSGHGSTLLESLQDLHLVSSEALAKHIDEKGWALGDEDEDKSDDDDDDENDVRSMSSASSASTLNTDAGVRKAKWDNSGPNADVSSPQRMGPGPSYFCMPRPADGNGMGVNGLSGSDTKTSHPHPLVRRPLPPPSSLRPPPPPSLRPPPPLRPKGIHVNGPITHCQVVRRSKPTKITVQDRSGFIHSFVEIMPHLWDTVTRAALREYALNKGGAQPAGPRAKVTWAVQRGVRTAIKCVLSDLSHVSDDGLGIIEFIVDVSDC